MQDIFTGTGVFAYPLLLCSLVAIFVTLERAFALRKGRILPRNLLEKLGRSESVPKSDNSVLGRLARFVSENPTDENELESIARLEINRLERGLVFLEIIISAAPLLGLLGTVSGLIQVFANIDPGTGLPEPAAFVEGVALALTTTVAGLAIAIPALVANGYFQRKIETFTVELGAVVEQIRNRQTGS